MTWGSGAGAAGQAAVARHPQGVKPVVDGTEDDLHAQAGDRGGGEGVEDAGVMGDGGRERGEVLSGGGVVAA